jgi:hypothetical protein
MSGLIVQIARQDRASLHVGDWAHADILELGFAEMGRGPRAGDGAVRGPGLSRRFGDGLVLPEDSRRPAGALWLLGFDQ